MVGAIGVLLTIVLVMDAVGLLAVPRWLPIAALPAVGAVIWRLGGASITAIASWLLPLAALLYLGFVVLNPPLDGVVIAAGYLWFVAMILSRRMGAAWYRLIWLR